MNLDTLKNPSPFFSEKTYKVIVGLISFILIGLIYLFSNEAYNGVLFKLKLCLYLQLILIISLQFVAYFSAKISHIKAYALTGCTLLFFSSFFLDNFFYGNVAGNFLRIYVIFAAFQIFLIWLTTQLEE
ncbi:hypothetical protein [Acinetobacter gyllenbergii]|uniref:hypothetical protein n=1 Tax=Acinetobacter gyllenbergii TaxID=134534 RepID=UPI003F566ED4